MTTPRLQVPTIRRECYPHLFIADPPHPFQTATVGRATSGLSRRPDPDLGLVMMITPLRLAKSIVTTLPLTTSRGRTTVRGKRMPGPGGPRTNRVQAIPPNVDQRHPTFPQVTGHPDRKSLVGVLPAALHHQARCGPDQNMPSPGGQASGMAGYKCGGAGPGVDRVWHPIDLPPGLPHDGPGAELHEAITSCVEGCPRAVVWSGYARPTGCHTSPSVQDHPWSSASSGRYSCWITSVTTNSTGHQIVWTLFGH
jgi:hypothetical protein